MDLTGSAGKNVVLRGVITRGRPGQSQYVTSYTVQTSLDGASWQTVQCNGVDCVFTGNSDSTSRVQNTLEQPVAARYVGLVVQTFTGL